MRNACRIIVIAAAIMFSLGLFACSGTSSSSTASSSKSTVATSSSKGGPDDNTTDKMYNSDQSHAEVNVYVKDGRVKTVEYGYELDYFPGADQLQEGHYYKLIASVTYLNGGVAGYVDFPQIKAVHSIEEVEAPAGSSSSASENGSDA